VVIPMHSVSSRLDGVWAMCKTLMELSVLDKRR